uniref:Coat protein n=1 Tax=Rubber tree latent virus 2 TaxID=3079710 RepID=A0AA96PNM8_9VIRU|nr:coat protein [Rubber tree latent virus 2]
MPYTESEKLEGVIYHYFYSQKDLNELLVVLLSLSFANKSERVAVVERIRGSQVRIVSLTTRFPSSGQFVLASSEFLSSVFFLLLESLNFCDSVISSGRDDPQHYANLFTKAKERYYACVNKLALFLSLSDPSELQWYGSFNRAYFESRFKAVWKEST